MAKKKYQRSDIVATARALQQRALKLGYILQHSGGVFELFEPIREVHTADAVSDYLKTVEHKREHKT